jgi:hypothetical protein
MVSSFALCTPAAGCYADVSICSLLLLSAAGYVMVVVLLGFLLHPLHHLDPAWCAALNES